MAVNYFKYKKVTLIHGNIVVIIIIKASNRSEHSPRCLSIAKNRTSRHVQNDGHILRDLSIPQIAAELSFSDQSFFGKFFKKKMKVSPKIFRVILLFSMRFI